MASSNQFYPGSNRYGYAQNMLDPNGLTPGTNVGALQTGAAADPGAQTAAAPATDLPHWLTDLSARGIGDDWSPDTGATGPDQVMLHPRVVPPDAPAPAQVQAQQFAPTADNFTNGTPDRDIGGGKSGGGNGGNIYGNGPSAAANQAAIKPGRAKG